MLYILLIKQNTMKKELLDNQTNQALPKPEKKFKIRDHKDVKS